MIHISNEALARRVIQKVKFKDVDISELISSVDYGDTEDLTDDVTVKTGDPARLFEQGLFPSIGDVIEIGFKVINHPEKGKNDVIEIGSFEIDSFSQSGGTFTIDAVSVPISGDIRSEKKYKTWENVRLKQILQDIGENAGLEWIYDSEYNPLYDKKEQSNESDLEFLESLVKSDGLAIKISNGKLVIFDKEAYDSADAVAEIVRNQSNISEEPNFKCSAVDLYSGCEITYTDSKTDNTYTGSFYTDEVLGVNRILRLRESYSSESEDIDFNRKAKSRLREQNEGQWSADVTMVGNLYWYAGTNVQLKGWNEWDGKYHITQVTHNVSDSGFTSKLTLRRCLVGY